MTSRAALGLLLAGFLLALAGCQSGDGTASSSGRVKGFYGSVGGGWNQQ